MIFQTSLRVVPLETSTDRVPCVETESQLELNGMHQNKAKRTLCQGLGRHSQLGTRSPHSQLPQDFGFTHRTRSSESFRHLQPAFLPDPGRHVQSTTPVIEVVVLVAVSRSITAIKTQN